MSPIITLERPCPECQHNAVLTNWIAPDGYDSRLRQYLCLKCGNQFYVLGSQRSSKLAAIEPPETEELKEE